MIVTHRRAYRLSLAAIERSLARAREHDRSEEVDPDGSPGEARRIRIADVWRAAREG